MQRASVSYQRPKKYTPTQVGRVCVYNLCHTLTYQVSELCNVGFHADFDCAKFQIPKTTFKRPGDGATIHYFGTVQDKDNDQTAAYPGVNEWIKYYVSALEKKEINMTDITLLPIVLVQYGRNHFNTLVITGRDKQLFVGLIEPKSFNMSAYKIGLFPLPYVYPVESIFNSIKEGFGGVVLVDVAQIKLGSQGVLNDQDCGAYHINAVECISRLANNEVLNQALLGEKLRSYPVDLRIHDGEILHDILSCDDSAENEVFVYHAIAEKIMKHREFTMTASAASAASAASTSATQSTLSFSQGY